MLKFQDISSVRIVQVISTQPTGSVEALITTTSGVSLIFDPLIRQPTQAAAAAVAKVASSVVNGRR